MFPIYIENGFSFFREKKGPNSILGDSVIVDDKHSLNELKSFLLERHIRSIRIIPAHYPINDLGFLAELPFIEGVIVSGVSYDLAPLQSLEKLRVLSIDQIPSKLDFSRFPLLEVFSGIYSKSDLLNLNKCTKLFWLWLDKFNEDNLTEIISLTNLEYLTLHRTSIKNLYGLGQMTKLKSLNIDTANRLESLVGISLDNSSLVEIDIYLAKKLVEYSSISLAKNLEKVRLTKTGPIKSIDFLDSLRNLKRVIIGSQIVDGDVTHLKKVPKVSILDFPHYNLKNSDFL